MCLDEIYLSLVLETLNDMLFELHQDKTFCKSVVKVSTNISIEWLDRRVATCTQSTQLRTHCHSREHYMMLQVAIKS